jgi:anti-sigma regulatory factor (Ser/Thr protein kinase)/anti-anti-sigma regulatory factor
MTKPVSAEFRGEVCVLRCWPDDDGEIVGSLRAELERCRLDGASDVVLDLDERIVVGDEVIGVLQEAAERFHRGGGELVVAAEEPRTRVALAAAGLVRPPLPSPGQRVDGTPGAPAGLTLPPTPRWEHEFYFAADRRELPSVRRRITAFAEVSGLRDADLFEFSVAVGEALANAVLHGSPRGADDDVRVRFFAFDDEVAVEIVDGGGGIDATPICAPSAWESSGRGIHFMRALADAVQFTCGPMGTHVLIVKRRS